MKTLYKNGRIHSMENETAVYSAMLIEDDRILALGGEQLLDQNPDCVVDLMGRTVLPGMTDSHLHFVRFGLSLSQASLLDVTDEEECGRRVAQMAARTPKGEWIEGGLWEKDKLGHFPTKEVLDQAAPDNPVYLQSKDYHTGWANSLALELCGIDEDTPDPEGGVIEKKDGKLTGILYETASHLIRNRIQLPSEARVKAAVEAATAEALSWGFTAVHTMEDFKSMPVLLRILQQKDRSREPYLRTVINPPYSELDKIKDLGLGADFGSYKLKLGGIKLFSDGALGSQTAWMLEDYHGNPGHKGMGVDTEEGLTEKIGRVVDAGFYAVVHAIGDGANRTVLSAMEKNRGKAEEKGLVHRVEHAQMMTKEDQARMIDMGLIASMQPVHMLGDIPLIKAYTPDREERCYVFRTLQDGGLTLTFGSDAPVEGVNPFRSLHAAVYRSNETASLAGDEKLTVYEAVSGFTKNPAKVTGDLAFRGTLAPGKAADFCVLDRDIFAENADILHTKVLATVLAGKLAYGTM